MFCCEIFFIQIVTVSFGWTGCKTFVELYPGTKIKDVKLSQRYYCQLSALSPYPPLRVSSALDGDGCELEAGIKEGLTSSTLSNMKTR